MRQVPETSRTSLFEKNSIPQVLEMPENNRVPFVVTWHHKLSALPKILHCNYETMVKKFPELKCIFPQPPVVAFRRNRNLKNLLVRSSFTKKFGKPHQPSIPCHSKRSKLCSTMSHSDTITNSISGKLVQQQEVHAKHLMSFMLQNAHFTTNSLLDIHHNP